MVLCSNGVHLFGTLEAAGDGAVHLNGLELPHSDDVVGVSGEEGQTISRPGEGDAVWCGGWLAVLVVGNLDLQLLDELLLLQIPDSDGWAASSAEPVSVWTEDESADIVGTLQTVAVLALLAPLELAQGVPELDGLVSAGRDDLSVVGGEGNGEYVVLVAGESGGGDTSFEVPESEGLVPRSGDSELTARADNDVRDEVVVALQSLHWVTVHITVSVEVPDDEGLVSGGGDEHIWELWVGSNLSYPAAVALERALQGHDFLTSHNDFFVCFFFCFCKFDLRL